MTPPPKNARPHHRHVVHHVEALAEKFAAMHAAAQTAAADHYAANPRAAGDDSSRTIDLPANGATP